MTYKSPTVFEDTLFLKYSISRSMWVTIFAGFPWSFSNSSRKWLPFWHQVLYFLQVRGGYHYISFNYKLVMHYCLHSRQKNLRAFKLNYKTNLFIFLWLIHWRPCREDFPTAIFPISTNTEYLLRWKLLLNFSKFTS